MDAADDVRTPGGLIVPAAALEWSFARSGGPGGQHVNTASSKATLSVVTDLVIGRPAAIARLRAALGDEVRVTSQGSRSQWQNRRQCLERLIVMLDTAARPPTPARRPTRPSRGAVERRLEAKRKESDKKRGRRGDW
jgi:ribosome-associated protein